MGEGEEQAEEGPKGKDLSVINYYKQLFNSDIELPPCLDYQLRIWLGQLVENSVDMHPKKIEVRLVQKGSMGFDIIDDGLGIPESEFENLCRCYVERHENQRYKEWSIGYRGEALCSLARCAELKVITKFYRSNTGYEVLYNDNGDVI